METPPPQGYVQYPRYGPTGPRAPMPAAIRFEAIGDAWQIVQKDIGLWMAAALLFFCMSYISGLLIGLIQTPLLGFGPLTMQQDASFFALIGMTMMGNIISSAVQYAFLGGILYMGLHRIRHGVTDIGMMFVPFKHFLTYLFAGLLYTLLIYLGCALVVIPGLWLMGALAFVPFLIVDQKANAVDAIRLSFEALKNHAIVMFALLLVVYLIVAISAIFCVIPILITFPVAVVTIALHYNAFFPPVDQATSAPEYQTPAWDGPTPPA